MSDAVPILEVAALERLERLGGTELVTRMIGLFLENAPARVDAAVSAARDGDAAGVERAAHSLRSSAANVGAAHLQHRADAIEAALVAGEEIDLREAAAGLRSALEAVRPLLAERKDAAG